jgi:predicted MFS family arabinose efflux permease
MSAPGKGTLRQHLAERGLSLYPLSALASLSLIDTFQGQAFTVLTPDISRDLGLTTAAAGAAIAVKTLASSVSPLPIAMLSQRPGWRVRMVLVTGIAWGLLTLFTGFATSAGALILFLALDGLSTGSVTALHPPLIMEFYPPQVRVRAMSIHSSAQFVGNVLAPLLVAILSSALGLGWRGVFFTLGVMSVLGTLWSLKLRDPGYARWDEQVQPQDADELLGFKQASLTILAVPTLRRIFVGFTVFGLLAVPLATFSSYFLKEEWGLNATQRGVFFAYTSAASIVGLVVYGGRGERAFATRPSSVPRQVAAFFATSTLLVVVGGLSPYFVPFVITFGLAFALIGPVVVGLQIAALSLIPARARPYAQALASICIAFGGIIGALTLGGVADAYGVTGSLVAVGVPGLLAAAAVWRAASTIDTDLAAHAPALVASVP